MIKSVIFGDFVKEVLAGRYPAAAHGCNAFCTMGKGIAVPLRQKVPGLYAADCKTERGDRSKMGSYTFVQFKGTMVINAYTQYTYWNPRDMLDMDAVKKVFTSLNRDLPEKGIHDLLIPAIGAGLAKGDWYQIVAVINQVTPNLNVHVVIWDGEKDQKLVNWGKSFEEQ